MLDDPEVARPAAVPIGYRVGRWVLEAPIASGAWSSVYAARPLDGGGPADVAVKFLPVARLTPQQAANLRDLAAREAACLRALQHPALVAVLETFVVDDPDHPELDGAVVLVMERAAGNLRDSLIAARGTPLRDGHELLRQLATALVAVHEAGWVHGDVKPANVLLMEDGTVRLADFGLAGELEGTHAYLPLLGSEDYLPPEWWTEEVGIEGVPARPSRDVWAYGVVAHQVLTGGRHPFPGATARARSSAARAYARGESELRLDDVVPDGWRPIIRDCLAPTHEARARHTAAAVLERVEALDPAATLSSRRRRPRRRRLAIAGAVLVAAAGGVVTGLALLPDDGEPPETAPAPTAFSGGELAEDAAVPAEYREMINDAAHGCAKPEVTPALIAAMLKAESDFDAAKRSPETDEYGIALWTPSVFEEWRVDADGAGPSVFSPADSIAALGKFLCTVGERNAHIPGDKALVLAAVYRGGGDNVRAVNGIPPPIQPYIDEVATYIDEYAEPANG